MKNKKTILLIHGFKRKEKDDFESFKIFLSEFLPEYNVISPEYYDNNNKKTLDNKKFKKKILDSINDIQTDEIYIVGYSMGALASLTLFNDNDKVKKIFAVYPPFKIIFFDWVFKLNDNRKKKKEIIKKLGKEKYKKIEQRYKNSKIVEKHPVKIVWEINLFRIKNRRKIKECINKDINIIFTKNDEIIYTKRAVKYFDKRINKSKNNINFSYKDYNHFTVFEKNEILFNEIKDFFEK